ncbi:unnamed protein product [Effrenium voratum]|nr:unnamed protein product [Effrenium voratum]CAJ1434024.1 unnamed protein product [Effrenium voratum]
MPPGGLLVHRYDPGPEKATAKDEAPKKRQKVKQIAEVAPTFARVFKGGPKRRESDLPVQEDEGVEEAPVAPEAAPADLSWLTSLVAEAPEPKPAEELDWLTSLKAPKAKPKASQVQDGQPKRFDDGRALPIPPFWRTAPLEQLEKDLLQLRERMLPRIKRMAKDAQRAEQKRGGHMKPRTRL